MLRKFSKPGSDHSSGLVVNVPTPPHRGQLDRIGQDLQSLRIMRLQLVLRPLDPASIAGKKLLDLAWPGSPRDHEFQCVGRNHLEYQPLRAPALTNEYRLFATTPWRWPVVRQKA